jgi:hypothetical protein
VITQSFVKRQCYKPRCEYYLYTIPASKSLNGKRQVVLSCYNKKGQEIVAKFERLVKTEYPGAGCTRYIFE